MPLRGGRVLGLDVAGTVHSVGAGVTDVVAGDVVFGTAIVGDGSLAEFARARVDRLTPKPERLSLPEAAAVRCDHRHRRSST
ncbi:alcohol dehydrogenase catalytic domain-containing protein [Microbacterium amylolyticum]|uniref:NADPH:quinone reductase-like Zn-dependent oxidoreductase n=1 Tax=Microbacterium amylolyticum TaxID=936337 RepID=A0ABS4ZG98_9MICO|nr:NADPH:quinone reductase-like Zn-dependent oxidoreductase [Microbacterium amylolyticum]